MKILLDECVPWPIRQLLSDHQCITTQQRGWGGIRNGDLLQRAEGEFSLFLTADQSLRYQQNLTGYTVAILQLSTNKWRRIYAALQIVQIALAEIRSREYRQLEIP